MIVFRKKRNPVNLYGNKISATLRRVVALVLVFVFMFPVIPNIQTEVHAEGRGRYVFPRDTDSQTTGNSFTDDTGLPMTIYNPNGRNQAQFSDNGNSITLIPPTADIDHAGFSSSVNKYNIANNDFEITFNVYHGYVSDNDWGFAFVFHNDPYHKVEKRSGRGSLGIYGAYTDMGGNPDSQFSALNNALAVELDGAAYRTYPGGNLQKRIFFDDTPLCSNFAATTTRYAHLAITRPGYANCFATEPLKIHHYVREDVPTNYEYRRRLADNSTVNIKWELTGQNVNNENVYTLTSRYYHDATTASGTPAITISQSFTYSEAFGQNGLFGGTEEVYIGFSAGREHFLTGNRTKVNLVDRSPYEVHHVSSGGPPWPPESDELVVKETRYALLNSKIDLTDRKKVFSDRVFDKAYLADGTVISDISSVDFSASGQKYYMSYVKNIIEDPTTPNPPAGYRRIVFNPTYDGKITDSGVLGMPKAFDVYDTLTWGDVWTAIQSKVSAVYMDDSKKFNTWNPALPTDVNTVISSIAPDTVGGDTTTFTAVYRDTIIENPTPAQLADEDYVIVRFDANDLNNGNPNEVIRGRLKSRKAGSTVNNQESVTYAVLKGTKWSYFAEVAATPELIIEGPYWLFNQPETGYAPSSWKSEREGWMGGVLQIPDPTSEELIEIVVGATSSREITYYAQYSPNTPTGIFVATKRIPIALIFSALLLVEIALVSTIIRRKKCHDR